jgi:hypothetical protein
VADFLRPGKFVHWFEMPPTTFQARPPFYNIRYHVLHRFSNPPGCSKSRKSKMHETKSKTRIPDATPREVRATNQAVIRSLYIQPIDIRSANRYSFRTPYYVILCRLLSTRVEDNFTHPGDLKQMWKNKAETENSNESANSGTIL